jgi:predicted nucleic acid-binding protein
LASTPDVELWVPDLFYVECANVLWKHVRRQLLPAAAAQDNLRRLGGLALISVPTHALVEEAFALAAQHDVTAYDAVYAALAQSEHIPLITADEKLLQKLAGSGCSAHWLGAGLPAAAQPPGPPGP